MLLTGAWLLLSALSYVLPLHAAESHQFPAIFNTEKSTLPFPTAAESLKKMTLPEGFKAQVFASEPDVQNPIAFTTDTRGRLWVAENYTYAEGAVNFDKRLRDRIVILEDTDHDGRFDKRVIFWDQGDKLSSVEVGFGGVWATCAPYLYFIPDANGDDVPDGEPQILLDGWNDGVIRHNIVNGLKWGPDGWLYGRHGIQATSLVGAPGTPANQRTKLNCCVWRYHPVRKTFEVVAQGTTNPWGTDWNEQGELFFINTVIGHLFYIIPGAHYKRMYGEDLTPNVYSLIDQHADHYHWDTKQTWMDSREAKGVHGSLGGGHAHSGLMFYLGDNWPDCYRDTLFTVNLHGRRLNNDLVERSGSGYTARHGADLVFANDPWFRALDLIYGPDGGVYICDWTDVSECHEQDGVHRTSGRIYKITYGTPTKRRFEDVSKLSDEQLVNLQTHKNDWFVRQARRVLHERAAAGQDLTVVRTRLRQMFSSETEAPKQLRALWSLYLSGGADDGWLLRQLTHPQESVRSWAIRLLLESGAPQNSLALEWARMAKQDPSASVRLTLASALQKLPPSQAVPIAEALLNHAEDAGDHNLPLMIWYGVKDLPIADPGRALSLLESSRIPLVRTLLARRLAGLIDRDPRAAELFALAAKSDSARFQLEILQGAAEALRGWRKATRPGGWEQTSAKLAASESPEVRKLVRDLAVLFGDGRALDEVRQTALDSSAAPAARRDAIQTLMDNPPGDPGQLLALREQLEKLVLDRPVAVAAARGLAAFDDPKLALLLVNRYSSFVPDDRPEVISVLVSRASFARALLDGLESGKIPRKDVTPFHARQMRSLNDQELNPRLVAVWGQIRGTPEAKQQLIQKYRELFQSKRAQQANASRGRELFVQSCGNCHKLFGEGASIGPDLTGGNRDSLEYLLENMLDPSALVPADFRMSVLNLKDGRILNGLITQNRERTLTLRGLTEETTLERAEVQSIQTSELSLMPEGLIEGLSEDQALDLMAYLSSPRQVPLPAPGK